MEKEFNPQLELFGSIAGREVKKANPSGRTFFGYLHGHEKVILFSIAFVIVGAISFSLGVEKGKRLALLKSLPAFSEEASKQAVLAPAIGATSDILIARNVVSPQATAQAALGRFTVQLASYRSRVAAEKEVVLLKKKGFSTIVLTKGNYTVLCVGNFNNKEEARSFFLTQVKKQTRFQEYLIRRLT